jgi:hypothetical protein
LRDIRLGIIKPGGVSMRRKEIEMQGSSRLIDQPTDTFPFNQETYDRVTREFEEVERRFRRLEHAGNDQARQLGDLAAEINGSIQRLWSAVVSAENRERRRQDTAPEQ